MFATVMCLFLFMCIVVPFFIGRFYQINKNNVQDSRKKSLKYRETKEAKEK